MPMRDYANLKDITIPPEQEAIMNIVCETWDGCRESECQNCPDRPKKFMSIMECFSLKFSRKLMEAGYAPVARCKDCKYYGTRGCAMDTYAFDVVEEGFCSYGERKEV